MKIQRFRRRRCRGTNAHFSTFKHWFQRMVSSVLNDRPTTYSSVKKSFSIAFAGKQKLPKQGIDLGSPTFLSRDKWSTDLLYCSTQKQRKTTLWLKRKPRRGKRPPVVGLEGAAVRPSEQLKIFEVTVCFGGSCTTVQCLGDKTWNSHAFARVCLTFLASKCLATNSLQVFAGRGYRRLDILFTHKFRFQNRLGQPKISKNSAIEISSLFFRYGLMLLLSHYNSMITKHLLEL